MDEFEKERELLNRHKEDAQNTLNQLKTMKRNVFYTNNTWESIVEARTEHINAFLKSLEVKEKEYEHFK